MAIFTSILNLLKKNPATDGADTFNIQTMLNDNWDKIDGAIALKGANGSVRAATVSNTTLLGLQTVDGVSLAAGDRVLVKDQTTGSQNGIYVVASGAWARAADADASAKLAAGLMVYVREGTTNRGKGFVLSNTGTPTLGTTALIFMSIQAPLDVAATASTAIVRDNAGRAQVAAPSGAADIARKDTVDAAIATATADATTKTNAVQSSLTAHIGTGGTAHAAVTTSAAGFMSAADKSKLDGLASGAGGAGTATDNVVGNRTISDATAPTGDTGSLTTLFGWLAYMIAAITGGANWRTAPVKSLAALNTEKAPLASPTFTGAPTAPTAEAGTNTTQIATTAFATAANTTHAANNSHIPFAVTTGTANTYAVTISPAPTSLTAGLGLAVQINVASTGAATINVNGLGAKSILTSKGSALPAGKLALNGIYTLRYNGTAFILQGEGGEYGTAAAAQVLYGSSVGTEAGLVSGSLAPRMPNLIYNGAFSNNLAGWSLQGSTSSIGLDTGWNLYGGGGGAIWQSAAAGEMRGNAIPVTNGHKYYFCGWAYLAASGGYPYIGRLLDAAQNQYWISGNASLLNQWQFASTIVTATSAMGTLTPNVGIWGDNRAINSHYDGYMLINLTDSFGVGKEPGQATMDAIVQANGGFWDSVVSSSIIMRTGSDWTATTRAADGTGGIFLTPPPGYYDTGSRVIYWDGNFVAANILAGKSIFGVAGTAIQGKRSASGTGTTVSTLTQCWNPTRDNYDNRRTLTISGLGFLPSYVYMWSTYTTIWQYGGWTLYTAQGRGSFSYGQQAKVLSSGASFSEGYTLENLYVVNGGFKLPFIIDFSTGGITESVYWIAIE